jgi:hypothetical protein
MADPAHTTTARPRREATPDPLVVPLLTLILCEIILDDFVAGRAH